MVRQNNRVPNNRGSKGSPCCMPSAEARVFPPKNKVEEAEYAECTKADNSEANL